MRTLIKICGITTPGDARLCVEAGADRLGVIFAASPRRVSPAQAKIIARAVPDTPLVGVFGDCEADLVQEAVRAANLSLVQVHRCAQRPEWNRLAELCRRPVLPALTVDELDGDLGRHTLLLDLAKDPLRRTAADRQRLYEAAARLGARGHRVLVAGGLNPANVAEAIERTGCIGVDVCGGVERAPGRKDPELVRRFVAAVRAVDGEPAENAGQQPGERNAS